MKIFLVKNDILDFANVSAEYVTQKDDDSGEAAMTVDGNAEGNRGK